MTPNRPALAPAPARDEDVPAYWQSLGLHGLADIHVHFMPEPMLRKVWDYFDHAEEHYGTPWPITYRQDEAGRLDALRALGLKGIPALNYAHKPQMAQWLNEWGAEFAARVPDAVHSATIYPEPGAAQVVRSALAAGARLFKLHVQVGRFSPLDPLLDEAWAVLAEAAVPVVMHAGSAPLSGEFTGPAAVAEVLRRHPDLALVIAHLGMSEYHAFADLAETHDRVHLDTTMVGTDFTNQFAPLPSDYLPRLAGLGDKVVLGSDFPQIPYPYAHQLEALHRLDFGEDWLRKVLWHNGARLMGLG